MGYPLRWEQLALPPCEEQPHQLAAEEQVLAPRSVRRYFHHVLLATFAGSAVLVLSVIAAFSPYLTDRQASTLQLEAPPAGVAVLASAPSVARRVGYVVIAGSVVNRAPATLVRVEAVVDLLDADRRTLSTQTAMIDRDSIAPGQASRFQLVMPDEPVAKAYRLHFKRMYGADLN